MSEYSKIDKLLHRLALDFDAVQMLAFDLEKKLFQGQNEKQNAIYVTGMARAGTTALMRALYQSSEFASLTYNDMPFVLSPNLWDKLSRINKKNRVLTERAHGDGIAVDFDSPEAFEEIFWRIHCGYEFIFDDCLTTHKVSKDLYLKLLVYQNLVCQKYNKQRYLAKNNNLILRLADLALLSKNTTFLIVVRHPLHQAASLLTQHRRFSNAPNFNERYMNWLAHHEFGSSHRPFKFNPVDNLAGDSDSMKYWIARWVDLYRFTYNLLKSGTPNTVVVIYEHLCDDSIYVDALSKKLDVPIKPEQFIKSHSNYTEQSDSDDLHKALDVYESLCQISRQSLGLF